MYSKRSELIKPCTEVRLMRHGLNLKIEKSVTLSTDIQRAGPFNIFSNQKLVSIESTPGFIIRNHNNFGQTVSEYLFSIGIKGLAKVIWLPLYKAADKKGGSLYSTEKMPEAKDIELVGFVYINKARVKKENNAEYVMGHIRKHEIEQLKDSVNHYTKWLNDDIYGVTITDAQGQNFPHVLDSMTYHGIYNIGDTVNEVVDKMIDHVRRIMMHSKNSIKITIKVDRCGLEMSGWDGSTPLSAHLNSMIDKLFGTKLALANAEQLVIKGTNKGEFMELLLLTIDLSRLPKSLQLSEDEYNNLGKYKRYHWEMCEKIPEWDSIKIHALLASMIDKVAGVKLLNIGDHKNKKEDYLKIPWRQPVANRKFQ